MPLPAHLRSRFLERVAELLSVEVEIGDGTVARAARPQLSDFAYGFVLTIFQVNPRFSGGRPRAHYRARAEELETPMLFDCAICFAVAALTFVGLFGLLAVLRKERI